MSRYNDDTCWAQVGDDYCPSRATHGEYCKKHYIMFEAKEAA